MDWNAAIEKNREALKRILGALVAMLGLAGGASVLPRRFHRTIVKLLHPAEAAVRRLIIVAARGMVVAPPRLRPHKPRPKTMEPLLRRLGIAVVMSAADIARAAAARAAARRAARPRKMSLPLLDPLTLPRSFRGLPAVAAGGPRIRGFDSVRPAFPSRRRPVSRGDSVSATRLSLRLAALAAALDDLPGQARRFARWRASLDARAAWKKERAARGELNRAGAQDGNRRRGPYDRLSALKPGRPPGWRRKPTHEVHDVLNVLQGLALWALERPRADTS